MISTARPEWIFLFTGLRPAQFRRLVRLVAERGGESIAEGRPGRQRALDLADRVLLVAAYWRSKLTMRQIVALSWGVALRRPRIIDTLGPLLALTLVRQRPVSQIAIVDCTLIPTRDHRLAAASKNYQHSANLQVAIDASTRPGHRHRRPITRQLKRRYRLPHLRHLSEMCRTALVADGVYCGNPEVIPYREPPRRRAATAVERRLNAASHRPSADRTRLGQKRTGRSYAAIATPPIH